MSKHSGKFSDLPKANDYLIIQSLTQLTGVRTVTNTLSEYTDFIDEHNAWPSFPYAVGSLRVVYERVPIISQVMFPSTRKFLINTLLDSPGRKFLFMDSQLVGKNALFWCSLLPNSTSVNDIIARQMRPSMLINSIEDGIIVAVPLTSYV